MKQFACGDVVPGCKAVFSGADDAEILRLVAVHARNDHGMTDIPEEVVSAVRLRIVNAA